MQVLIPSALRSYTESNRAEVNGATLAELLVNLDRQYPGIFINGEQVQELSQPLKATDDVVIVQALSGG
jgi:molybdopterin converting factor small subunit